MPRPHPSDRLLLFGLRLGSALAASLVLLIAFFLLRESGPGLARVGAGRFLSDPGWHPTAEPGEFNLVAMGVATLATTLGAILLAGPLGILCAVWMRFYAPAALARLARALIQVAAGVPSVVYGFWGLVTLVPLVGALAPPGPSLLSGILVLAMMIVPTVALLAGAALERVPTDQLQGAAALDLSRWTTVRRVVLPATAPGLGVAVVLATMRAVGETMAVLMVCGNVTALPRSLFDPVRTLTANIALELGYATTEHRSVLFVSGLALMLLVAALVYVQDRLSRRVRLA